MNADLYEWTRVPGRPGRGRAVIEARRDLRTIFPRRRARSCDVLLFLSLARSLALPRPFLLSFALAVFFQYLRRFSIYLPFSCEAP